jgi:hypothetical protein
MIDHSNFVMKNVWIGLVEMKPLLEDRLIVEVQRACRPRSPHHSEASSERAARLRAVGV